MTPSGRSSPARWIVIVALVLAACAVTYFWWIRRAQLETVTPAPTAPTDLALAGKRPKRQPLNLPPLNASDAFFRDLVSSLSHHPLLARLLATKDLVSSAVRAVEQIGDGKTPAEPLIPLRPERRFSIGPDNIHIDPHSYERWDDATTTLMSIRPEEAAQLYVNVKDLFDEAYRQLGHPNGDFDTAIVRAIQMVQDTAEPATDPVLVRRDTFYEYTDPALQALRPVQKQFLLTGPANRHKIMDWLHRFAETLDLKVGP